MTRAIIKLCAVCVAVSLLSGCVPLRKVTASHWKDNDTLYVAYTEQEGVDSYAKVQICTVTEENALACEEAAVVNTALNPPPQ